MFITEPSSAIDDPEQRRQARLSSALLLVGLISFGLNVFFKYGIWYLPIVLIAPAYVLSRTRYYTWGIIIYTFVLAMPSLSAILTVADQGMYRVFFALAWLILPILFIGLVSTARHTLIVVAILVAGLIALSNLLPGLDLSTLMPSLGFLCISAALISLAMAAHHGYSKRMVHNLQQLEESRVGLEQRVEERIVELQQVNERLFHEMMEREQAQREADIARDQAMEALKLKSQILANVSHDARTPLSVILLRTELMKRGT
jgi:signal transduction histidine kinase